MTRPLIPALLAGTVALASAPAAADVRVAAGAWQYDLAGLVRDRSRSYDFEDDLELEASGRRSVLVEWDTPAGWWPDLALGFAQLGGSGDHEETFTITAGGIPVATQTRTIVTSADFTDVGLALRYPLALGAVRAAGGIAVVRLRGDLRIDDSEESAPVEQSYDETFPMLHAQARWPLIRWLALAGSAQGIAYEGSTALEWRVVTETRWRWLLLEAGWQEKRYDISIDRYALDARLDGWLLRLGAAW